MRKLTLLLAGALLILVGACSTFSEEEQEQYDSYTAEQTTLSDGATALINEVYSIAPNAANLLSKSWNGTLTDAEAIELAALLQTGPDEIKAKITKLGEDADRWVVLQSKKNELRESAGGGWWEEVLIGVGAFVGGMGVPTSGPFGAIFAGLQPLLEAVGLRNPLTRRRRRYANGEPGEYDPDAGPPAIYVGPGDIVAEDPPPGAVT